MSHFRFLEHQNLCISLQKSFSFWGWPPYGGFIPGPHWGIPSPDPLAPDVQIL